MELVKIKTDIYTKLLDFQRLEITVKTVGKNDYFKKKVNGKEEASRYVTLNEVLEKVKKPLNDMGIVIIFAPEAEGLRTTLYDTESETKIEGYMKYVGADNAQKLLACNTYFRRGSLVSLLGLEDEDDDGNKASEPVKPALDFAKLDKPKVKPAYDRASEAIDKCVDKPTVEKLENAIADNEELTDAQKQALLVKLDAKAQQIPE